MDDLLRKNFTEEEVYPFRLIKKYRIASYDPQDMADVLNEFPTIEHEVVSGHFPFWFFQHKDPDFDSSFFFIILRDPVERVLSHYQMGLRKNPQSSPLAIPPNLICKMLCSDPTKTGAELLKESIANLERMDFIIFQDDYERGVKQLFKKLNLTLDQGKIPKKNTTEKTPVSKEIIQKIREMNDLDVQLYKHAVARYKKKN